MRRDEAFPAKFLKAADVKEAPLFAVISYVEMETVGQGTDSKSKPVMYFEGHDRPMVVNATNWDALADAYGDDSDGWAGHKIKIRCARTHYAGKAVDGLRVEAVSNGKAPEDES